MEEHLLAAEAVVNNDRNKTTIASYKRTIANMRKYAEMEWKYLQSTTVTRQFYKSLPGTDV